MKKHHFLTVLSVLLSISASAGPPPPPPPPPGSGTLLKVRKPARKKLPFLSEVQAGTGSFYAKALLRKTQRAQKRQAVKTKALSNLFKRFFKVRDAHRQFLVQHSPSGPYPPKILKKTINHAISNGIKPQEIVVAFDFDGTLSTDNPRRAPGKINTMLRGGEALKTLLEDLKAKGVHLVIDTAAKPGGMIGIQAQVGQYGIRDIFSLESAHESRIPPIKEKTSQGEKIYISNNIISGESGYDKSAYLFTYIAKKKITPKIVIFLDDAAINVLTMSHFFKEYMPATIFVGMHVPQAREKTERDFYNSLIQGKNFYTYFDRGHVSIEDPFQVQEIADQILRGFSSLPREREPNENMMSAQVAWKIWARKNLASS